MKRFASKFILLIILGLVCLPVFSYDLDVSVNNEIEQKYDSNKLNKDMGVNNSGTPKKSSKKAPKSTPVFDSSSPTVSKKTSKTASASKTGTKIPSGTKFLVKSNNSVSGYSGANTPISFTSTLPININGITIPTGTIFKGYLENSHGGQITGNGGLIEIKVTSMSFNGKTAQIEGKITKANNKNVFLNNIKGKRQYWTNVNKQVKRGVNIYNRAKTISAAIPSNPLGKVIKPVPMIGGASVTALYSAASPLIAVFNKGQNISLPAGTVFEIKLTADAYVN